MLKQAKYQRKIYPVSVPLYRNMGAPPYCVFEDLSLSFSGDSIAYGEQPYFLLPSKRFIA